jgi:hypothetical protein
MPFENSPEQLRPKEAPQPAQHLQLLPSAGEYQTFGANALVQRQQANNDLIGAGVLTALQFNFDTKDAPVLLAQGSAEQTGKVIDYPSNKVGDQIKSGMDWIQSADARSASEKLQDFLGALGKNGTNQESHKQYIQGELDKLIGVGEGLHISKEQTKGAAAAGWKALNDGTVADFLSKPNAINEPMFKVVSNALDALSKDPETANKALAALGTAIAKSSEHYSTMPDREKGHVIGHAMFNLFNPEGSTEAADAGLKIASTVATQVDKAVVQAVGQQIRAIEEIAKTAPEHAQQAKQMLYEYLKGKGLTGPKLEYAGVPKGYFDGIQSQPKPETFHSMTADATGKGSESSEPKAAIGKGAEGFEHYISEPINGAERFTPLGFKDQKQFFQAAHELNAALKESGITDATLGVRGSSVTGYSDYKGTLFHPDSDVDFFFESAQLANLNAFKGMDFVKPKELFQDFPLLQKWSEHWTAILGRPISPAAFAPGKLPIAPAIKVGE